MTPPPGSPPLTDEKLHAMRVDEATLPKAGIDAAITTEHDLQHEYDKYSRAEMMQSYGASERQIETMLKESNEMNTYRASTPWLEPAVAQKAPMPPCPAAVLVLN